MECFGYAKFRCAEQPPTRCRDNTVNWHEYAMNFELKYIKVYIFISLSLIFHKYLLLFFFIAPHENQFHERKSEYFFKLNLIWYSFILQKMLSRRIFYLSRNNIDMFISWWKMRKIIIYEGAFKSNIISNTILYIV